MEPTRVNQIAPIRIGSSRDTPYCSSASSAVNPLHLPNIGPFPVRAFQNDRRVRVFRFRASLSFPQIEAAVKQQPNETGVVWEEQQWRLTIV